MTKRGMMVELQKYGTYISDSFISREIKAIEEDWRADVVRSLDVLKSTQIERIKRVMNTAWEQFEASKKQRHKRTTVGVPKGELGAQSLKEVQVTTEETDGDPRWLEIVMGCIAEINKLCGLYAPVRNEVSGPGGGPIQVAELGIDPAHAYLVLQEEITLQINGPAKQIGQSQPENTNEKATDGNGSEGVSDTLQ